jgi:hypothetical protein
MGPLKLGGRHSNDDKWPAIHPERLPDGERIRAKHRSPQSVRNDGDSLPALSAKVVGCEGAPERGPHTKRGKIVV